LEGKGDNKKKRARSADVSYAEVCAGERPATATSYYTDSDGRKDWTVVRGRTERRRVNPLTERRADADKANVDRPKEPERPKRMRNRPVAILVKVGQGKEWIQVYSEMMRARDALKDSSGIRRTRAGDILIELKAGSNVKKIATELNTALGGMVGALPMRDKTSVEIKDTDPLMNKEELAMELVEQLGIKDSGEVEVKTLRLAPWGTQSAIITLPKALPRQRPVESQDQDRLDDSHDKDPA
jgi:hypothetical protein